MTDIPLIEGIKPMKKTAKTLLCTGVAAAFLFTSGYFGLDYTKKWVNQKIQTAISQYEQQDKQQTKQEFNNYEQNDKQWTNQNLNETVNQYEEKDKQWTNKKLDETITQYGKEDKKSTEQTINKGIKNYEEKDKQWTQQTFENKMPLEQIAKASESAYMVIYWATYKTTTGELIEAPMGSGSGILLKGGYFLTAQHVTEAEVPKTVAHPVYGMLKLESSELSLTNERASEETTKKDCLEKIIRGSKPELDYTLLKLKDSKDLPFYTYGLNLPSKLESGMQTIAIGYPLALGKNIRLGNITQTDSDEGEHYLTYNNNVMPSDSGGALFVIEDGNVKLVALSISGYQLQTQYSTQITNINYGVKISSVVKDMEEQLSSGKLDKKTAEEVENFLKLNKK
ncbi:MAG: serine protease [Nanoarchaeota archaeon]|nr:serine protease [Nanoarchaeota archaeon]